jgi:hypothetical protein
VKKISGLLQLLQNNPTGITLEQIRTQLGLKDYSIYNYMTTLRRTWDISLAGKNKIYVLGGEKKTEEKKVEDNNEIDAEEGYKLKRNIKDMQDKIISTLVVNAEVDVRLCASLPNLSNFRFERIITKLYPSCKFICFEHSEDVYKKMIGQSVPKNISVVNIPIQAYVGRTSEMFDLIWFDAYSINYNIDHMIGALRVGGMIALNSFHGRGISLEKNFKPSTNLKLISYTSYGHMKFYMYQKIK